MTTGYNSEHNTYVYQYSSLLVSLAVMIIIGEKKQQIQFPCVHILSIWHNECSLAWLVAFYERAMIMPSSQELITPFRHELIMPLGYGFFTGMANKLGTSHRRFICV